PAGTLARPSAPPGSENTLSPSLTYARPSSSRVNTSGAISSQRPSPVQRSWYIQTFMACFAPGSMAEGLAPRAPRHRGTPDAVTLATRGINAAISEETPPDLGVSKPSRGMVQQRRCTGVGSETGPRFRTRTGNGAGAATASTERGGGSRHRALRGSRGLAGAW